MPAVSANTYVESVATNLVPGKQETKNASCTPQIPYTPSGDEHEEVSNQSGSTYHDQAHLDHCLFCSQLSIDLEANVDHMSLEHRLYIPDLEHLSSLETMIRYLHTVVTDYNECIYCGITKQSSASIRRHMLDKGHCMINLEREPELLEFWELSDCETSSDESDSEEQSMQQAAKIDGTMGRNTSQGEYTLPSGKTIGSKRKARDAHIDARRAARNAKETSSALRSIPDTGNTDKTARTELARSLARVREENQGHSVALRDAAGLIGACNQQIRGLVTIQRKAQRQQAIVQASAAWADELGGRSQKHYKTKMNLRAG